MCLLSTFCIIAKSRKHNIAAAVFLSLPVMFSVWAKARVYVCLVSICQMLPEVEQTAFVDPSQANKQTI